MNPGISEGAYNVLTLLVSEGKVTTNEVRETLKRVQEMPEKDVQGFYNFQTDALYPIFSQAGYGLE
jgi:hypothetical protein